MRYSVLGPLLVIGNDRPLVLGGLKQRALLASLVLRIGQVVSVESLVDTLWPCAPPRTAVRQVQDLVSQLRRVLDHAGQEVPRGAGLIETRPGGYLLAGARDDVDVHEFAELRALAGCALQDGDEVLAAARSRAALDVWRGDALLDIGLPAIQREAEILHEQRLDARETWIDCEIAIGNGAGLVGQLRGWVDQNPLREALRRQLMVALHQAGRRAEALEAYRAGRELLIGELGIEPGIALRDAHQMILSEDSHGARRRTRLVAAEHIVPRQLPPDVRDLTGRAEQVKDLRDVIESAFTRDNGYGGAAATAVVRGGAGVGKSALAVHVAHQVGAQFADGHLYADLRGSTKRPADPSDVAGTFLRDLGIPTSDIPDDLAGRGALLRTLLAELRVLIVLDDARDEAQVLPLIPASAGCAMLVTTRRRIDIGGYGRHLDLGPLPDTEALTMLCQIVGTRRVATERDAATRLLRMCGHLPLAVRIAAGRLTARPGWRIADLVNRLEATRDLGELCLGMMSLRASFEATYQGVGARQSQAFRLLGLLDAAEFDLTEATAVLGVPAEEAEQLLERLVDDYLLVSRGRGRYALPLMLQWYARECLALDGGHLKARTHVA